MITIYPGSFDPLTMGHLDIIKRSSKLSDRLIVAVMNNKAKDVLFSADERVLHLKEVTKNIKNVEIISSSGLLVELAIKYNVDAIIRGLRSTSDFEYELQMVFANNKMLQGLEEIETLFIPTHIEYTYLSSSIVKEIAHYGGNINNMVPAYVKDKIINKINTDFRRREE